LKSLDTEVGAELLRTGAGRVGQVLCVDAKAVSGIANTIALWSESQMPVFLGNVCSMSTYKVADVQSLRDPVRRDSSKSGRKTVHVVGRVSAVGVGVASQASAVLWVTDKEDTLNGIESSASELRKGVHGGSCTLRVTLEKEALVRVGGKGALDLADDVVSAEGRNLAEVGSVDSVVLFATGDLSHDVGVHGAEAGRGTLQLASAASVDDGVAGACCCTGKNTGFNNRSYCSKGEGDSLEVHDRGAVDALVGE
jgi:hypothetical protein